MSGHGGDRGSVVALSVLVTVLLLLVMLGVLGLVTIADPIP